MTAQTPPAAGDAAPQRIGILGGTFDPPHLGHLLIAETARAALSLDTVLFLPAGQPWLKSGQPITPADHRLRMVQLATADNPHFAVCDCEIRRPGPSYTADTLETLRARMPDDATIYFIVGSDVLADFHRWHRPQRVLDLCRLAVFHRPGAPDDAIAQLRQRFPPPPSTSAGGADGNGDGDGDSDADAGVFPLPGPQVDISASELRRMLATNQSVRYQIPDPVIAYITQHNLYRNEH